MAAILHVTCPICPEMLDATVELETWGSVDASDIAIARVTLSTPTVNAHILAHGVAARLKAVRREHVARSKVDYPAVIARLDEQIAQTKEASE